MQRSRQQLCCSSPVGHGAELHLKMTYKEFRAACSLRKTHSFSQVSSFFLSFSRGSPQEPEEKQNSHNFSVSLALCRCLAEQPDKSNVCVSSYEWKKKDKGDSSNPAKAEMLVPNIWTDDGTTRKITQGQKKNEKVININKNKL